MRRSAGSADGLKKVLSLSASPEKDEGNVADSPAALRATPIQPLALLRDHNPALEFLKDETGRLVFYNRAFQNVFAPDGESLLGKADSDWLPAEVAERVR